MHLERSLDLSLDVFQSFKMTFSFCIERKNIKKADKFFRNVKHIWKDRMSKKIKFQFYKKTCCKNWLIKPNCEDNKGLKLELVLL